MREEVDSSEFLLQAGLKRGGKTNFTLPAVASSQPGIWLSMPGRGW